MQLPAVSTLTRCPRLNKQFAITYDSLLEVKEIIEKFWKENDIDSDKVIKALVSIDAFSVKPTLEIKDDGIVRGSILNQQIDKNTIEKMKENINSFDNFCKKQVKLMINDVFVINLQPLNTCYSC